MVSQAAIRHPVRHRRGFEDIACGRRLGFSRFFFGALETWQLKDSGSPRKQCCNY